MATGVANTATATMQRPMTAGVHDLLGDGLGSVSAGNCAPAMIRAMIATAPANTSA